MSAQPLRTSIIALGFGLALSGAAHAQFPVAIGDTVAWTLTAPAQAVKPGGKVVLQLRGAVKPTWHVYGLKQADEGPTPLEISVDAPAVASLAGAPTGSPPIKRHDPSFDVETQYYEREVSLSVPVRVAAKAQAGKQLVPVSVHFQTCDGKICQPPKTLKLTAALTVQPAR